MTLRLELTGSSGTRPGDASQRLFGDDGGTIGRAPTNTWVLSHNKVSGLHARITCRSGVFYIEDTSRNGVSVNSPDNRLVRNRPYALTSGDRIFIDPYEIGAWIEEEAEQPRAYAADPFAEDPFMAPPGRSGSDDVLPEGPVSGEVDPLKFFDPVGGPPPRQRPELPRADGLGQHFQPPAVLPDPVRPAAAPAAIPDGYNPLAPDDPFVEPIAPPPAPPAQPAVRPRPGVDSAVFRRKARDGSADTGPPPPMAAPSPPAPPPVPAAADPVIDVPEAPVARAAAPAPAVPAPADLPAAPASGGSDLAALLAGAGLPGAVVTPELTHNLGQILRVVVSGLMDVLQSRQRIKEEFRMQQTIFRPADNNPLKFSVNVEDALHNLLVKRNPAYLRPVAAFADAFDDLRDHQLAMLAGMRVAFEAMLTEFDPERLQEQFDRSLGKSPLALMPAKLRYWDLYRARRDEMVKDPEAAFERLFGEEFRRAYEAQFRELKAQRRAGAADPSIDPGG